MAKGAIKSSVNVDFWWLLAYLMAGKIGKRCGYEYLKVN